MIFRLATVSLLAAVSAGQLLHAQSDGAQQLRVDWTQPIGRFSQDFSGVGSVRELSNGSVVIADFVDQSLLYFVSPRAAGIAVSRKGSGPDEYRAVGNLHRLGGDSTVLSDPSNGRWLILLAGRVGGTVGIQHPAVGLVGHDFVGLDSIGYVFAVRRLTSRAAVNGLVRDSLAFLRYRRSGASHPDTITRLLGAPYQSQATSNRNPLARQAFGVEMTAPEQVVIASDGWTAVLRISPLALELRDVRNALRASVGISTPRIPVTEEERIEHARRLSESSGRTISHAQLTHWPRYADPVERNALHALPDGRFLVVLRRAVREDSSIAILVSRNGVVDGHLKVPIGSRIVGFGEGRLYLAVVQADGLESLNVYAWPPT